MYIQRKYQYIKGQLWIDTRYEAKKRLQRMYKKKGLKPNEVDYPNLLNDLFID